MFWVPMIDVSTHQGVINFATMRAKGIRYIILRVTHGATQDARVATYWRDALAAGFQPWEIGFYSFINPKRGSGRYTAISTASIIRYITGGLTNVLYMLDVENYAPESPNAGTAPVTGRAFSDYLRFHWDTFEEAMPGCRVIAYSNRAYWNSAQGPQDSTLAGDLEWIVPRYPLYSDAAYRLKGYPPAPELWDEYAFRLSTGPVPPLGATWQGWQFSAGYNHQGPVYGCQSTDLDLNIVEQGAAERWWLAPVEPDPTPDPLPDFPPIQEDEDVITPIDGGRIWNGVLRQGDSRIEVPNEIPGDATGILVNLTFRGSMKAGFATLWSGAVARPEISQLNWKIAGTDTDPRNGFALVRLLDGGFTIYCHAEVEMIIDLVGYTSPPISGPKGDQGVKGDKGDPGPAGEGASQEAIVAAVIAELSD